MSVDRRLEHELFRNAQAEEKRIRSLDEDRKQPLRQFQAAQDQLSLQKVSKPKPGDLADLIKIRDDSFFRNLHILQQYQSAVKFVTDYKQPIPIPKIKNLDGRVYSSVEQHDPIKSDYLANFEAFLQDKKTHEKNIERINKWIIDLHDELNALVFPRILSFLLEWIPTLLAIYRYFYPINALDEAILFGNKLEAELRDLENQIEKENTDYYSKWAEKNTEYSALSMNERKLQHLRAEQALHEQMTKHQEIFFGFVKHCDLPSIQGAYGEFEQHPNYLNLFHLVSLLTQEKFNNTQMDLQINQVLESIGKLYPDVHAELEQYTKATLFNLQARTTFELLEDKYQRAIVQSQKIQDKRKQAQERMAVVAQLTTTLNPIKDAKRIATFNRELQELNTVVEKAHNELHQRLKFITPLKNFLLHRTGENLQFFYQFMTAPENENAENTAFSNILRKLYPAALETMAAEQQGRIIVPTAEITSLMDKYLSKLIKIENSFDPNLQDYKETATALRTLLSTADWKWEHFNTIKMAIKKNPEYYLNPTLAEVFNTITELVVNSRQFKTDMVSKPISSPPVVQVDEALLNQSNALPMFFQPPARVAGAANNLIKNIIASINEYLIRTNDQIPSSKEKQTMINRIGEEMLQYIDMLSGEDAIQNISPQHLSLLGEMASYIEKMRQQTTALPLNESDIQQIRKQLKQLDTQHPIRKGMEFLIDLYQSKSEYVQIDTKFAKMQLEKDIKHTVIQLESDFARKQKISRSKNNQLTPQAYMNIQSWAAVSNFQNLIKEYLTNLQNFPSPQNTEEAIKIQELLHGLDQIKQILRYEQQRSEHIPAMIHDFEQNDTLKDHPVYEAGRRMLETMQETEEYAKLLKKSELRL